MTSGRSDRPALPARLAERYELEERLADGGSAEVWRGRDRLLERPVAVKLLHRHLLTDPTTRTRLDQEARAAASLAHPGIVGVYDVASDDAGAAVVFELVDGESLSTRLRREGRLPAAEAARIAAEVGEALDHAHQRGVIHRDVKPSNVLLERDGRARLVDFGIARLLADAESRLTAAGTITGTLRYLAPEQLRGEPAGPAADIYALGVSLAEMLSGQPPYQVDTPVALAEAQRTPPSAIDNAPPALAKLVRRALDPDPERRSRSAGEFASELRAWLAGDPRPQPEVASPDAPTETALPIVPPVVRTDPPRGGWRLWPLLAALGGVAVVAVVVVVMASLVRPNAAATSSPAPTPRPVATSSPAPKPPTLAEAVDGFKDSVASGREQGLIERGPANDLLHRADEIVKKSSEGKTDEVARKIDELRRKIDEFERNGRIASAALAASLRDSVDRIEAAT